MIAVEEAKKIISGKVKDFGVESISTQESIGRVLREELQADRDLPPYNRVTMDGIAIDYRAFEMGQTDFPIAGIAAAGAAQMKLEDPGTCFEVMTGAILPQATDTVIRYEDLDIKGGMATILIDGIKPKQNVHRQGEDRLAGDLLVQEGKIISPAEMGVAATTGKSTVEVSRLPKTLIISTGDELVPIEATPLPHQVRRSNVFSIQASLLGLGINADTLHINDDWESILSKLKEVVQKYEVLIFSGGVSKGKFDFLPKAFADLGIQKLFHKVKQRPGKPFWFGEAPNGTLLFALPGNPVSSFLCTYNYILPWLRQCLKVTNAPVSYARLAADFSFKPDLTYYLQVKLAGDSNGVVWGHPVVGNGSGDLANLTDADAFLELPRGKDHFSKGEVYPLIRYRL